MEKIFTFIAYGKYKAAWECAKKYSCAEIKNALIDEAYKTENISIYSFANYLIEETSDNFWRELAIELLLNPLCAIEGSYSIALYHARKLLSLCKSIENYEQILFFYELPETLLERSEAVAYAKELLELNPGNVVALRVLNQ
jgi:hypothetical protein